MISIFNKKVSQNYRNKKYIQNFLGIKLKKKKFLN